MKLANRIDRIKPSPTMAMAARARELMGRGIHIVNLGLGEPDFRSPEAASKAGINAIQAGYTKYTPPSGADALKEAIIQKLRIDNHLDYDKKEIIVSCGAKHTLYNIAQVLFEEGDEVIIPAPYWVSYPDQIRLNDATPVIVETREEDQFLMTPDQLKKAITPRTKGIILNSPSNPTGATYRARHYEAFSDHLLAAPIWIISDEIYEKFLYDDTTHTSIASLSPDLKRKTIVVNGVSKTYAMTGWRIGYAAGPREIIGAMATVQSQSTSNPASISQKAAAAALTEGASFVRNMIGEFDKRRRFMTERLNQIPGIRCPSPAGSFYLFPNVKEIFGKQHKGHEIKSSGELATFLLEEGEVTTIPGEAFGAEGYLRISYAAPQDVLALGLERIEKAIKKLS
ncbi:MAG: pyridoxal phosphate-dependent aminotransferase [Nitrospiria bacterium]